MGRFLFFIFTAVALVASLSANGVSEQTVSEENTRVIIDVWNREVVIPEEVDLIAAIGSMGPRMAAYLDVVDMLVGAEDSDIRTMSVRYDYSPVYHDAMKNLPSIGTGGGSGENNAYPEELIMLDPDVIMNTCSKHQIPYSGLYR